MKSWAPTIKKTERQPTQTIGNQQLIPNNQKPTQPLTTTLDNQHLTTNCNTRQLTTTTGRYNRQSELTHDQQPTGDTDIRNKADQLVSK